jgi:hypothetical protein
VDEEGDELSKLNQRVAVAVIPEDVPESLKLNNKFRSEYFERKSGQCKQQMRVKMEESSSLEQAQVSLAEAA